MEKRKPPNAGKGRRKGVPNKMTQTLREMILQSLADAGGAAYLLEQAKKNPNAYLSLIGRVLPLQVKEGGAEPTVPGVKVNIFPDAATAVSHTPRA